MPENNYLYPFDPTGTASSNLITGEQHIISPPVNNDFYFVVPKNGPFFERNLKVTHYPSGAELINGVDFHLGWKFISASRATAKPVFGAICILNRELTGVIVIDRYQALGGDWQINEQRAAELLLSNSVNPRTTSWEQVEELPYGFPVIDHEWDLDDMVGATELVESIDRVTEQLLANVAGAPQQHISNTDNPHNVTKSQVGLGNVDNFSTAGLSDLEDNGADNKFITPFLVRVMINSLTGGSVDEHLLDRNNPHQVTKLQVGLGSVENYGVATNAEMESALPNNKYMTPANLAYYFASGAGVPLQTHISRTDNPHGVTKIQVGLGNVQNYQPASLANYAGVGSSEHYVTPNSVVAYFNQQQSDVVNHILDETNPHNVTKSQVGLSDVQNYGVAVPADFDNGGVSDRYLTPALVVSYVNQQIAPLSSHITAQDNPHNVTKSQVGLGNIQNFVIAGIGDYSGLGRADRYVTPDSVVEFVSNQLEGAYLHTTDETNPHNVTKAQIGLSDVVNLGVLTLGEYDGNADGYVNGLLLQQVINRLADAVSNDVATLNTSLSEHINAENPHNITPQLIGAASTDELAALSSVYLGKTEKAADTTLFDGMTTESFSQMVVAGAVASIAPTLVNKNDAVLIVPQRNVIDQGEPTDPENPPAPIYTSLEGLHNFASITLSNLNVENAEISFIVSGHRGSGQNAPTAEHIGITLGATPTIKHHSMLSDTDVRFGYSIDGDVLNIWMTAKDDVVDYTLVSLSKMNLMDVKTTPVVTDVVPAGFVLASKTSKENPFGDMYDETYVRTLTRRFSFLDVQLVTIDHMMGTVDFDIVVKDLERNEIIPMIDVIDENNIMLSLTQMKSIVVIITFYLPMSSTVVPVTPPPKVVDVTLTPVWTTFNDSVSFFNANNSVMTFESSGTLFKHWEADWPDEEPSPNLSTAPRSTWGSGADLAPRTMLMTISLVSRYTSANNLNYLDISVPFDTPISLDNDVPIEFIEVGYVPNGGDIVLNITITDSLDNTIVTSGNYTMTKLGGVG